MNRVGLENFKLYLASVNRIDDDSERKKLLISKKKIEQIIIGCIGISFGLITVKVMIEQMISQWGVYLK